MRTMREAYQRLADVIEHLPDERLLEPAMDNWTGKDLLAHIAWWHDHSVLVIDASERAGSYTKRAIPRTPPTRSTSGSGAEP